MSNEELNPTEQKFDTAVRLGIAPYNWIPPEALPLKRTESQREHFDSTPDERLDRCKSLAGPEPERGPNEHKIHDPKEGFGRIPHPKSDYSHTEPIPRDEADLIKRSLKEVEAFRRMSAAFEWIGCRASSLMAAINDAITSDSASAYQNARKDYIEFLKNLSNHHPNDDQIDIKKGFGFGANLHWVMVDPVIRLHYSEQLQREEYLITGLTLVAEWNPHISSSGVPIKHS